MKKFFVTFNRKEILLNMLLSLTKLESFLDRVCKTNEASTSSYNILNTISFIGAATFVALVTLILGANKLVLQTFSIPIAGFSFIYLLNSRKLFGHGLLLMYLVSMFHGSLVILSYDTMFLELICILIAFMPLIPFENLMTVRIMYFMGYICFNLFGFHLKSYNFLEIYYWPKSILIYFLLTNIVFIFLYYFLLSFKKDGLKFKLDILQKNKEIEEQNKLIKLNTKMLVQFEQEKNEMELAKKQRDLETLQINNQMKIKMKNDLIKELQKIKKAEPELSAHFQPLINKLKHQIEEEKDLDFKQNNISIVGSDFAERIKTKFPDLTRSEVELLSYIKIGLRNKQIATQKNTSQNTVNVALHRLKEKCGFDSLNELRDFVGKF